MDYNLTLVDISLSQQEKEMIEARMALDLSRFTSLICQCNIQLALTKKIDSPPCIECAIQVSLRAGHEIEIVDFATSVQTALTLSVQRTKRAIKRHLKNLKGPRLGLSVTSKT